MITIDGNRKTFGPAVIRKAHNAVLGYFGGSQERADAFLENCLWIVSLSQWAQMENECTSVAEIVAAQADSTTDLGRGIGLSLTLCGAPVYRNISGNIGAPDGSGPDVLLITSTQPPEVLLRISGLIPA